MEKAQEEIGDERDDVEEEGAGGREKGCNVVAPPETGLDSERRTSSKVRPFQRGRLRA